MRRRLLTLVAVAASVSFVSAGRAAVVAADDFESYAAGSQLNGQTGGTGFSGAYAVPAGIASSVTVQNQSLSYTAGAVTVSGGTKAVQFSGAANGSPAVARTLATSQAGTLYYSFLFQTNQTTPVTDQDFVQVGLDPSAAATEPNASVGVNENGTPSGTNPFPQLFFARVPNGSANQNFSNATATPNTTFFVVAKVSKASASANYNQVDLYVNPTTLTEPATTSASSIHTGTQPSLAALVIRTVNLDAGDQYFIDRFTVGTTYADVVPEPAAVGLFALAGTGLLARRRSKTGSAR